MGLARAGVAGSVPTVPSNDWWLCLLPLLLLPLLLFFRRKKFFATEDFIMALYDAEELDCSRTSVASGS